MAALKRGDVEELADTIHGMLRAIYAGDLDTTSEHRHQLIGAYSALRIVLGDEPDNLLAKLRGSLLDLDV
jgi:hypothetical protein